MYALFPLVLARFARPSVVRTQSWLVDAAIKPLAILLVAMSLVVGTATADELFSIDPATDELVRIDAPTGIVTVVGTITHDMSNTMDLTFHEGFVYAVIARTPFPATAWDLVQIDPVTGLKVNASPVTGVPMDVVESLTSLGGDLMIGFGNTGTSFTSDQIAIIDTAGNVDPLSVASYPGTDTDGMATSPQHQLIGVDYENGANSFSGFRQVPATPAPIGGYNSGHALNDLEFCGSHLYGISANGQAIHRIDPTDGSLLKTRALQPSNGLVGLAKTPPSCGRVFSVDTDSNRLVTIDQASGFVSDVGGIGFIMAEKTDLAFHQGKLYAVTESVPLSDYRLLEIDCQTGAMVGSALPITWGGGLVVNVESLTSVGDELIVGFGDLPPLEYIANRLGVIVPSTGLIISSIDYTSFNADFDALATDRYGQIFSSQQWFTNTSIDLYETDRIPVNHTLLGKEPHSSDAWEANDMTFCHDQLLGIDRDATNGPMLHRIDSTNGAFLSSTKLTPPLELSGLAVCRPVCGPLYSVNPATDELIRLEPETGDHLVIGQIIGHNMSQMTDLAFHRGSFYALTATTETGPYTAWDLVEINPDTGAMISAVPVTATPPVTVAEGLTSVGDDLVIGFGTSTTPNLGEKLGILGLDGVIDPASVVDHLSFTADYDGLGTDPSGQIFGMNAFASSNINESDRLPSSYTPKGGDSAYDLATDIEFCGSSLFAIDAAPKSLYRVDERDGSVIGSAAYDSSLALYGLAARVPYHNDLVLIQDPLVAGQSATFRVYGGEPGESVYLLLSLAGIGNGPCFFGNTFCLDLLPAINLFGPFKTNCCGFAEWTVQIPGNTQNIPIYSQVIILRPPGANSVKSNAVCMIIK